MTIKRNDHGTTVVYHRGSIVWPEMPQEMAEPACTHEINHQPS
jgi:hypothetical protein